MTDDDSNLAAELALGLLEGEERSDALRRQLAEPAFAREVERWRDHFATLFPQVPEAAPSDAVEERVLAAAGRPGIANDSARASAGFWKPAAIAASLVAAGLAGVMLTSQPGPTDIEQPGAPVLIANFTIEGADQPRIAIYEPERARLTMPGDMPIPADHRAQLWASVDGSEPVALGNFEAVEGGVAAEAATDLPAGTVLMITFEPLDQPTSQPTGDTIAEGVITTV